MPRSNWKTSEYTKVIAIKAEQLEWIKLNKGKKSAAGFLDTIINQYKKL
jgi:hypothetical protein